MKKSDVQCSDCGAGYRRIELISKPGKEGHYQCLVCGRLLEAFDGKHEVAYRLTVNPEHAAPKQNCHIRSLAFCCSSTGWTTSCSQKSPVCTENLNPEVVVMKSAQDWA
jgi:hypothetical protein